MEKAIDELIKKMDFPDFPNRSGNYSDKLKELFLYSFGMNEQALGQAYDYKKGLDATNAFVQRVSSVFGDYSNILSVTPFIKGYLGKNTFDQIMEVILERAEKHEHEQQFLDEVLTSCALLKPENRQIYISRVKDSEELYAETLDLESLLTEIDSSLYASAISDFPEPFNNNDEIDAARKIHNLLTQGLFVPSQGFTEKYHKLILDMGSVDFLFKEISLSDMLLIDPDQKSRINQFGFNIEVTGSHDTRPNNNGKNPGIIISATYVSSESIRSIYPDSTILYISDSAQNQDVLRQNLGESIDSIISIEGMDDKKAKEIISKALNFIKRNHNKEKNLIDYTELLKNKVECGLYFLKEGDDLFYDVQDELKEIGKGSEFDGLIKSMNLTLPKRTDNYFSAIRQTIAVIGEIKRLKIMEDNLKILKDNRSFENQDMQRPTYGSFANWYEAASNINDPFEIRNHIYFGFQPLYDALIRNDFHDGNRHHGIELLNSIMNIGLGFFPDFYKGKPNIVAFQRSIKALSRQISEIDDVAFRMKGRSSHAYSRDIKVFLESYLEHALSDTLILPYQIIGTACGGAEMSMALAGLTCSELGFLRSSKRREDERVVYVDEHLPIIQNTVQGKNIVCVEDWVSSGNSLARVMKKVNEFKPSSLIGVSLGWNGTVEYDLKPLINEDNFKTYELN